MAQVKFGKAQLAHPTPTHIANRIDIFAVIAGAITTWMGTQAAGFIPAYVSTGLQSILGLSLTIALAIKPFFGVDTKAKNVPIDSVSEMTYTAPKDEEQQNSKGN